MKTSLLVFSFLFASMPWVYAQADDDDDAPSVSTNRPTLLQWHRKLAVGGYDAVGSRNPKWDALARDALDRWARIRARDLAGSPEHVRDLAELLTKAAAAGCDDPLVAYAHHKYTARSGTNDSAKQIQESTRLALNLGRSGYDPFLKFFGHLRAAQTCSNAARFNTNYWRVFTAHCYDARSNLWHVMRAGTAPVEEVYDGYRELLKTVSIQAHMTESFWTRLEPEFFRSYTNHYLPWLLKADHSVTMAWKIRGNRVASEVKESAWAPFEERLKSGEYALRQAWQLNSNDYRIPNAALRLELGLGQGREVMEKWFQRAMSLNPSNVVACRSKMYYLEPKWYGSPQEMLAFGRQCLNSRKWTGRVPLMLADAHDRLSRYAPKEERTNYWKAPAVWRDIRESYETFLALHPKAASDQAAYANYAYLAGQFDVFLKQAELLGQLQYTNYTKFGGKESFDRMLRQARDKTSKK